MENPNVSFVIPCFNDSDYIVNSINSAVSQVNIHMEVIVVDDGSNFKTKEVIKSQNHKIDVLITQENKGQASARNRGIEIAKGEYIVVLDSDDFFEPSFAKKASTILSKNLDCKLVTCWLNRIKNNKIQDYLVPNGGTRTDFLFRNGSTGSSMFRKTDWVMSEGYDESMTSGWEDWEFFIRLLGGNGHCHVIEEILFNYRIKENSTTSRANTKKKELLRYIMMKHHELYIDNYPLTIDWLLNKVEKQEVEIQKNYSKLEYRLGIAILYPLRFLKKIYERFRRED